MGNLNILFHQPVLNLQLVVDGILVGAIFALVAYGMALVWGVMNLVNVAQGELVVLGGYVVFYLSRLGVYPLLAIPAAAVLVAIFARATYHIFILRVVGEERLTSSLATFGVSILMHQLANQLLG